MNILAVDIGGSTRNGFCLMNTDTKEIIKHSYLMYDKKLTKLDHRKKILAEIQDYYYNNQVDAIIFEKINLYRGSRVSPLANILSLCRVQSMITDNMSDLLPIYEIPVKTWKSISLGSATAQKEDSIKMVKIKYPTIDLIIPKKRANAKVEYNHDLADAICIARAVAISPKKMLLEENRMNYK